MPKNVPLFLLADSSLLSQIVEVRVRAGDLVDLVQLITSDGFSNDGGYSSDGGQLQPAFVLEPGERLVRVEAAQSEALHGLRLVTSTGRESPWYGNSARGTVQVFEGSAENPIVGIERSPGSISPRIARAVRLDGSSVAPADVQSTSTGSPPSKEREVSRSPSRPQG